MEINIQSLEQIHEAAKQFVQNMGDNTVFAFYGKRWEPEKLLLSRLSVRNWA